jgi:DNA-binding NtrC family response regulator
LTAGLQVKLLRLLQEGTFQRLGDPEQRHADFRIVAATNSDLLEAMARGDFRSDLYYRLQFLEIRMAPLRERREDIIPLANLFVRRATGKDLCLVDLCEAGVIDALVRYAWPGNVRELEGLVRRLCLLIRSGGRVSLAMLPGEVRRDAGGAQGGVQRIDRAADAGVAATGAATGVATETVAEPREVVAATAVDDSVEDAAAQRPAEQLSDRMIRRGLDLDLATWLREAEVLAVRRALTAAAGRKSEAAQLLGISRNTLYKKLDRLGLRDG